MANQDNYFILSSTEDGISVSQVGRDELLRRIVEDYGSDPIIHDEIPDQDKGCFILPGSGDRSQLLIIKGKIVVPQPVRKISHFEVE